MAVGVLITYNQFLAERHYASIATIDAALDQVRMAAFELRPAILDDLGLAAALRSICARA